MQLDVYSSRALALSAKCWISRSACEISCVTRDIQSKAAGFRRQDSSPRRHVLPSSSMGEYGEAEALSDADHLKAKYS